MQRKERQLFNATFHRLALPLLLLGTSVGTAQADTVLWNESFEGYSTDAGQVWGSLAKNNVGGANAAANGVGNPWFAAYPKNGWVTKATVNPVTIVDTVTPHSGQFMLRGGRDSSGWMSSYDANADRVNLAYRFNGGNTFKQTFKMDWWFYDMLGNTYPGDLDKGPVCFGDHASLEYAAGAPTTTDYVSDGDLGAITASLGLGAYEGSAGYDPSVYQAQVQGASDAQFGDGWFNTTVARTRGWHHAAIAVDWNDLATFTIDGTTVLTHSTLAPNGFNLFTAYELDYTDGNNTQSAYYDDISLTLVPEPNGLLFLGLGAFAAYRAVCRRNR